MRAGSPGAASWSTGTAAAGPERSQTRSIRSGSGEGSWRRFELGLPSLARQAAALVQLAPIRHLRVHEVHGRVGELAELPLLTQLATLDVASSGLTDLELGELVQSSRLANLRMLSLVDNPITIDGLRALARARLPRLSYVITTQTRAQLVHRDGEWDDPHAVTSFTRTRETLFAELGHLPWLDHLDVPSVDAF